MPEVWYLGRIMKNIETKSVVRMSIMRFGMPLSPKQLSALVDFPVEGSVIILGRLKHPNRRMTEST